MIGFREKLGWWMVLLGCVGCCVALKEGFVVSKCVNHQPFSGGTDK